MLFWKPQVVLFVNEPTRLPVFVRLAPAATLVSRFVADHGAVLAAHGLEPRFIDSELAEMTEHRLEKTASRSVLRTMNPFSYLADADREQRGVDDLVDLSLYLAGKPCGPLREGHGFPDLELKALAERILDAGRLLRPVVKRAGSTGPRPDAGESYATSTDHHSVTMRAVALDDRHDHECALDKDWP